MTSIGQPEASKEKFSDPVRTPRVRKGEKRKKNSRGTKTLAGTAGIAGTKKSCIALKKYANLSPSYFTFSFSIPTSPFFLVLSRAWRVSHSRIPCLSALLRAVCTLPPGAILSDLDGIGSGILSCLISLFCVATSLWSFLRDTTCVC